MTDSGDRLLELYAKAEAQQQRPAPTPAALQPRRVRATAVIVHAHEWPDVQAFAAARGIPLRQSRDVEPGRYVLAFTSTTGAQKLHARFGKPRGAK